MMKTFYELDSEIHKVIGGGILDNIVELARTETLNKPRTIEKAQETTLIRWNNFDSMRPEDIPDITFHRLSFFCLWHLYQAFNKKINKVEQ